MTEETKPAKPLPDYAIQLRRCGEALFGSSWSGELARYLSAEMKRPFDQAIVRRWARGVYRPPAYAWVVIAKLLQERAALQREVHADLLEADRWRELTGMELPGTSADQLLKRLTEGKTDAD